jgi:hypothetical protein
MICVTEEYDAKRLLEEKYTHWWRVGQHERLSQGHHLRHDQVKRVTSGEPYEVPTRNCTVRKPHNDNAELNVRHRREVCYARVG